MSPLDDPRVIVDAYVVRPTCYVDMDIPDRDLFCLNVVNGHKWGWSVRRGSSSSILAMNRKGEWIAESGGSGHNKARRWPLEEALAIALQHVDTLKINGHIASDLTKEKS